MAKRGATTDLNHDNWDRDYETEEAGTFRRASDEALKARVIKTARRRNPISSDGSENKINAFGTFSGFGKDSSASTSTQKPPATFDFLKKLDSTPKTNGPTTTLSTTAFTSQAPNVVIKDDKEFWNKLKELSENVNEWIQKNVKDNPLLSHEPVIKDYDKYMKQLIDKTNSSGASKPMSKTNGLPVKEEDKKLDEYFGKLKGLNESVSEWINKHVCDNPLIDLAPVIDDYQKYMNDLDKLHKQLSTKPASSGISFDLPKPPPPASTISASSTATSLNNSPMTSQFKFGAPSVTSAAATVSASATTSSPKFSFGSPQTSAKFSFAPAASTTTASSSGFSFGSTASTTSGIFSSGSFGSDSKPSMFSFGNPSASSNSFSFKPPTTAGNTEVKQSTGEENDDEDQPPKVEFTPVVEEGHIYTVRCKVFVKKDNSYGDRGIGNLYLKPIPNNDKVQLIVRADTNLGNLLCNLVLSSSIPIQRMGKKDVMMVCSPIPEPNSPPCPVLLRVKSPEEADELLKVLKENQK